MIIAIMGAGAVGSYFGGLLAKAGLDVTFIARGAHLKALQEQGLRIKSYKGDFSLPVKATSNPEEVGKVDLVLFCVKAYHTEEAARLCLPMVGPETVIISLQNGVDNEEKIAAIVCPEKVMGGVAYVGVRIAEPGFIEHSMAGRIVFGELDGRVSQRAQEIEGLFQKAGVPAQATTQIRELLWSKLAWNAAFNAISALTRTTVQEIINNPDLKDISRSVMDEVATVAMAHGIALQEEDLEKGLRLPSHGGDFKTSMLQDLEAGKTLELEELNGFVIKKGKEKGISTPYNYTLFALLKGLRS